MRMALESLEARLLLNSDCMGLVDGECLLDEPGSDGSAGEPTVVEVGQGDDVQWDWTNEVLWMTETDDENTSDETDSSDGDVDEQFDVGVEVLYFSMSLGGCGEELHGWDDPNDIDFDGVPDEVDDTAGGENGESGDDGSGDLVEILIADPGFTTDDELDGGLDTVDGPLDEICKDFPPIVYSLSGSAGGVADGNGDGVPDNQGPDEVEPNDTIDTANVIELQAFPTFAPGLSLFGANLQGNAGGDANDVDVFAFDVAAGYHINVGVVNQVVDGDESFTSIDEWIQANGLNDFGDAIDTAYIGGTPLFNEATGESIDRLAYILSNHPELIVGLANLVLYDAEGNVLAESGGDLAFLDFWSESGGTYYAEVSMDVDAGSAELASYRLGILTQSGFEIETFFRGDGGEPIEPKVVVLHSGDSFDFTDSDGDDVEVDFRGRGTATITFAGHHANGSDIASIVINGARRGSLTVQAGDGSTDVGSIEIHQAGRGARHSRGFGRVEVDGNLGSFASDLDVRALAVDGMLGDLSAAGARIGSLRAELFDVSTAEVGSIVELHVQEDGSDDLLRHVLAWE